LFLNIKKLSKKSG